MRNNFSHTNTINLPAPRSRTQVFGKLAQIPDIQLIFVAALACTRHRGNELVELQRRGVLSYLLLDSIDMITGDYISKTKEAAAEISKERKPSGIILMCGCQSALLSTDYGLLTGEIEQELGIPVRVHDGCRLCGFEQEETDAGAGNLDLLAYDFIPAVAKSGQVSVSLIGGTQLDEGNELLKILRDADVQIINSISECRTFEEYKKLGSAHLNIITSASSIAVGEFLEEKLNIPFICLDGVYDGRELAGQYEKLSQILGCAAEVSSCKAKLDDKLASAKRLAAGSAISVEGNAALAKWLICEGFNVESLSMGHKQSLSKEDKEWFNKNAPKLHIASADGRGGGGGNPNAGGGGKPSGRGEENPNVRGGRGSGGGKQAGGKDERGGGPSGRGGDRRGGRPGGPSSHGGLLVGFAGAINYLDMIANSVEGGRQH